MEYDDAKYISENYYAYKKNNLWGVISEDDDIISSPLYSSIGYMKNGLVQVTFSGINAIINEDNQVIWYQVIPAEEEFRYDQFRWRNYPYNGSLLNGGAEG